MTTTRLMAVASLCFAVAVPLAAWALGAAVSVRWFAAVVALFLFYTHRSNLRRLLKGEEDRLGSPARKIP